MWPYPRTSTCFIVIAGNIRTARCLHNQTISEAICGGTPKRDLSSWPTPRSYSRDSEERVESAAVSAKVYNRIVKKSTAIAAVVDKAEHGALEVLIG